MLKHLLKACLGLALIWCNVASADISRTKPIHEDAFNLSAKVFLQNFSSQNPEERKSARLYLLGVLDSTEGNSWCNYEAFKTISINEFIYEKMKNLPEKEMNRRASYVIKELLSALSPCNNKK